MIVAVLGLASEGVAVLGPLPSGIPPLGLPDLGLGDLRDLLPGAAAIALVAAADTLVSSRAFAARNGYEVDANRDLIGLGAANASAGLSGGITVSASAARTAVAESVGSRTQLAGLTAAATMTLVLVFATGFLRDVPVPALAAVVTAAVLRLFEPAAMRTLWRVRRTEFAIAIAAMAGVALIGVLEGVVIAMALSLFDFLRRTSHPHDAVLGVVPGRAGFHDMRRVPATAAIDGALVFRFDAPLFYANAQRFRARVRSLTRRHDDLRLVVLEASTIPDIDVTAARMLGELRQELGARGMRLVIADAVGSVGDLLVGDELGIGVRPRRPVRHDRGSAPCRAEPRDDRGWVGEPLTAGEQRHPQRRPDHVEPHHDRERQRERPQQQGRDGRWTRGAADRGEHRGEDRDDTEQPRQHDEVLAQRSPVRDLVPVLPEQRGARALLVEPQDAGHERSRDTAQDGDDTEAVGRPCDGSDCDVHTIMELPQPGVRNGRAA